LVADVEHTMLYAHLRDEDHLITLGSITFDLANVHFSSRRRHSTAY
jgi:hypothetical protein